MRAPRHLYRLHPPLVALFVFNVEIVNTFAASRTGAGICFRLSHYIDCLNVLSNANAKNVMTLLTQSAVTGGTFGSKVFVFVTHDAISNSEIRPCSFCGHRQFLKGNLS